MVEERTLTDWFALGKREAREGRDRAERAALAAEAGMSSGSGVERSRTVGKVWVLWDGEQPVLGLVCWKDGLRLGKRATGSLSHSLNLFFYLFS